LILWIGIILNLLILIAFKYLNFIIDNINLVFEKDLKILEINFPLAISFFTFQSIVFLINCYDNQIKDVKIIDYCLFITFFPQLVAGPIVKYNEMVPQFNDDNLSKFKSPIFYLGITIFLIGFIKKTIFADTLGSYVDQNYLNIDNINIINAWLLSISFTFQFYFDFSGYVDMATGSALMLNIKLAQNFNSPFKSLSIIDFWHRWHITLSNFLTNFVFTPWIMSLKKINFIKTMIILLIVFLLAGLWHGPSWTFVVFGLLHGLGLILNHCFRKFTLFKINKFFAWFLTFNYINLSFLMFRSENLNDFLKIFTKMLDYKFIIYNHYLNIDISNHQLIILILSMIICFYFNNSNYLIGKFKRED
jgi:alginate O-acetyltransferase complex protein AlgI